MIHGAPCCPEHPDATVMSAQIPTKGSMWVCVVCARRLGESPAPSMANAQERSAIEAVAAQLCCLGAEDVEWARVLTALKGERNEVARLLWGVIEIVEGSMMALVDSHGQPNALGVALNEARTRLLCLGLLRPAKPPAPTPEL